MEKPNFDKQIFWAIYALALVDLALIYTLVYLINQLCNNI
jgi:hypothetical protein